MVHPKPIYDFWQSKRFCFYFFTCALPRFFPIYTHPAEFDTISENLRKHLKGKSCFHFKNLDAALEQDIQQMVAKGVAVYQKEGLV